MSSYNFMFVNELLEEFSDKYNVDLRNTPIQDIKDMMSEHDWAVLHDAIKYGKDIRKVH